MRTFLLEMIEDLSFEEKLPPGWTSFDLENFSKNKKLWDFQQEAIKNAIKVLWKYFEEFVDYQEGEKLEANDVRKEKFFMWYKNNGLDEKLDITLDKKGGKKEKTVYNLLTEYYPRENGKIPYKHFINRIFFWMATGSGKSLIIIKLIHILRALIKRKEIPPYDILFLTHRDDLIEQLKKHVDEFNYANEEKINLKELKEYPEVKRQRTLFEITVFYYRSDNLSDEQKEKIIDFRNYDNNGKWYIFLDEAHKGDKEESKRQHIYSILSRNGFLFNFSATFTDPRDIITCAFEFNLSSFIKSGYGKHINILKGEVDFLVIKEGKVFHVFYSREVMGVLTNNYEVKNSQARGKNQFDDQKVIFKVHGKTMYETIKYEEIKREIGFLKLSRADVLNALSFSTYDENGISFCKIKEFYRRWFQDMLVSLGDLIKARWHRT